MNTKKAQVWYTDFMIGVLIFVIVIFIYYEYAHSLEQNPTEITSDLMMEAKSISSSLITKGSPVDWNQSNVKIIGLTDGNQRLVQEKLDMFNNMTYQETRTKFGTPYDYYFYLEEINGNRILIDSGQGIGLEPTDHVNLVSITRVVIYNSRLISMVIQVWQ
ncbi:hypothetical protein KY342_02250 [Candidatus Woesearchaeota archaeon]|nr:hypothetical protein [Candidatus Woesearchaeota archaeon]